MVEVESGWVCAINQSRRGNWTGDRPLATAIMIGAEVGLAKEGGAGCGGRRGQGGDAGDGEVDGVEIAGVSKPTRMGWSGTDHRACSMPG